MKIDIQPDKYSTIGEIIRAGYILAGVSFAIIAGLVITGIEWITGKDLMRE